MTNNIFLVDLPESELAEIKSLCESALVSIQGEEAQATYITVGEKESKIQLRVNGGKSNTFMCIVSKALADKLSFNMQELFKSRKMYIFTDITAFRGKVKENFPAIETVEIEDEAEENIDEENEIEETQELDNEQELFVIPQNTDELSTPETMRAKINALIAEKEILEARMKSLQDEIEANDITEYKKQIQQLQVIIDKNKEDYEKIIKELRGNIQDISQANKLQKAEFDKTLDFEIKAKNDALQTCEYLKVREQDNAKINEEYKNRIEELEKKLDREEESSNTTNELADELIRLRNEYDTVVKQLGESNAIRAKLQNSIFSQMSIMVKPRAVNAIKLEIEKAQYMDKFRVIFSGSSESITHTADYINRVCSNIVENTYIIDFSYETILDWALQVSNDSDVALYSAIQSNSDISECFNRTKYGNVKYIRFIKGFFNDTALLGLDWNKVLEYCSSLNGNVILHLGGISGVVKGVLVNTFSSVIKTKCVICLTASGVRTLLFTLSSFKTLDNFECVALVTTNESITANYKLLASKYKLVTINNSEKAMF